MGAPNRSISAGNQYAFWGQVGSDGFFAGTSGAIASGATGEPMMRILGIQKANPGPVAPTPTDIPGDDTLMGQIDFGPNTLPKFEMDVAVLDLNAHAILQSTTVMALGDLLLNVLQPNAPSYPDCCIIYQAKAKSQDVANTGAKKWSGQIIPLASIAPLGRVEFSGRAAAVDRYQVTVQSATKLPWGVTITNANLGTTGGPLIEWTGDNPITMHGFVAGGGSTFNLSPDYLPVSGGKMYVFDNTTQKTVTVDYTVVTTTGVITFVSPPMSGHKITVLYEFSA